MVAASMGVTLMPGGAAVSMTLLGVVTTNRPPACEATVRVANSGDVTIRPRLSAVDDWSPAGAVPAQPPELELQRGRHRDVLVRTRRPLVRPIGRHRSGAVTVYADLDGRSIPGPVYEVPPLVSRRAATVAMAGMVALVVGLGAVVFRPTERPERPAPDAATAVVERSSARAPDPAPTAAEELPADVIFDGDDVATHTPVLVGRDRRMVFLPPGGRVAAAVKVPSGWAVKRQVAAGQSSRVRFRALYVRGGEVLDLAPGVPDPSFWVDETGTRIAVDGRDGTDGAVTVLSLPDLRAEATTVLPAHVRPVAWLGGAILVSIRDEHFGRWAIADPYQETPSTVSGRVLGAAGGGLAIHQRDGELDCIVHLTDIFRPAQQSLRCGFGVPVDGEVLHDRWSAVSPGGRFLAIPGPDRTPYFAPLPAMLQGLVGFQPATGLPGPVLDIAWRDGTTAALLVRGDGTRIWTCAADRFACQATPIVGLANLSPVQLVTRVPSGG